MGHFRKIVVDGVRYHWWYRRKYLLVIPEGDVKAELRVDFSSVNEYFWFHIGFPVFLHGKKSLINLNHPAMIANIIRDCGRMGMNFENKKYWQLDGIEVLEQMGYELAWR